MDLLAHFFGDLRATSPGPADDFWYRPVGTWTPSGQRVTAEDAQRISAWYRGRDILATVVAMLPLPVYARLPEDGGSEIAKAHPLYDILHDQPNEWQDSFQWRKQKVCHLIDHGNGYDFILSGARGFVDQLLPIHPTLVKPEQITSGPSRGRLVYRVRDAKTSQMTTYTQEEIFHLRGASDDGIVGKGILDYARTSLGTALATESYAAQIYRNGALWGGALKVPGVLDDEAAKRMAKSFVTSPTEYHLPKVLEQGAEWQPNDMTPEKAQMLLSRKFSIDDMARWLGVPRQMLENSDPSFGNAEQFDQNFITYSLGGWLSLFEFAINTQLIIAPQRYYAEFTRDAIVRGKFLERAQGNVMYANAGIFTVDEIRGKEGKNKRGGKADELREPQNITGRPRAPEPPAASAAENDSQARAIVIESAARLLRKEVLAVQRLAVKHAADGDAFTAAVSQFYTDHVPLVQQTLQVATAPAQAYCASQAAQAIGDWLAACSAWKQPDYAEGLAAMALHQEAA